MNNSPMDKEYNPTKLEPKWQQIWAETKLYRATDNGQSKSYVLDFFPYPSGAGLSVGHVRNYTISDLPARFLRMQGHNVLHPMGWDAFGLPAENYAIKNKLSPRVATDQNKATYKRQMQLMGFSYDWDREIDSTDPKYYRWTQWFFLLLYKRGLAYKAEAQVNWCPQDKTVLANEQVVTKNGQNVCERCGHVVEKRTLKQWFFKITEYADRLLADLDGLNWPEGIKQQQRNWIGRSQGAKIKFKIEDPSAGSGNEEKIEVFTTRIDTLYGATFMVLAPEHPMVTKITSPAQKAAVEAYVKEVASETEIERQSTDRTKTGVFTGAYATNPVNNEKLPIWVADYVLMGYGTGAIMAVPAHDERDMEFAQKFKLEVRRVINNGDDEHTTADGKLINSGKHDGLASAEARKQITKDLGAIAELTVNYRMRDWLISRQRYWGAPIPIVYCDKCGTQPVPEDQLPVVLPEVESYEPTGDARSPLANIPEFVKTTCPKCDGPAERETDTMDGFACSSWYFMRFADPHNVSKPFSADKARYWLPVDLYIGGAEHAVMHLLYARFWTKVMQDEGLIDFGEPFLELRNQGMILAQDGRKMSKSLGNVITPDEVVEQGYGADALRLYEMFIAPFDQAVAWNQRGIDGTFRFLKRLWALVHDFTNTKTDETVGERSGEGSKLETALLAATHRTIKKVTDDIGVFGFNTAVASMMEYVNELYKLRVDLPFESAPDSWKLALVTLIQLLAPFAPFVTEELWQALGGEGSVHVSKWPKYDEKNVKVELIEVPVQVNGKLRGTVTIDPATSEDELKKLAAELDGVKRHLEGKAIAKTIVVPRKLVNFVVR